MESAVEGSKQSRNTNRSKTHERKSHNPSQLAANDLKDPSPRGHASEVIPPVEDLSVDPNQVDKEVASLQKHRIAKSSNKSEDQKSSIKNVSENNRSEKKFKQEAVTASEGEKWVETHDKVTEIYSTETRKEDARPNNSKQSRSKKTIAKMSESESKATEKTEEKPQKQGNNSKSKSKTPNKTETPSEAKSIHKNTSKSMAQSKKVKKTEASELKRSSIKPNDLTNEQATATEEPKSRKKSTVKSKH